MKLFGQYELRAVVEHLGNAEAGHYMAYCLVQQQPHHVWEMCSDERHHVVPEQTVMNTQATMLFYEAV
jgi:ubiquitin C-terminal hydrolase